MSQFHGSISLEDASLTLFSGNIELTNLSLNHVAPNLFYSLNGDNKGFCVAGTGISNDGRITRLLTTDDWGRILEAEKIYEISGHFAGIQFDEKKIVLFTCPFGLRDLYLLKKDNRLHFTTNYHTLFKIETPELNPEALGGRWLLYNQLDSDSLFVNYKRLSCGEKLVIDRKTLSIRSEFQYPYPALNSEIAGEPVRNFINAINSICSLNKGTGHPIELSLSGGLDSRVLLSLLIRIKTPFSAHSFGEPDNPDVAMARQLCERTGVKFTNYTPDELTIESAIQNVRLQAQYSLLNHPSTSPNNLGYYKKVVENGFPVIIDGGFGELWRRQFFYKLSLMGRKAFIRGNRESLIPFLSHHRADIFRAEVLNEMEKGCSKSLDRVFAENPQLETMGIDNWIDLISLRTRLPNYYSQEQTMIDGVAIAIMPFVQKNVLDLLFSTPLELKRNSSMLKRIVRNMAPELTSLPLVKSGTTVPFSLGSLGSRVWSKVSSVTGKKISPVEDEGTKKLVLLKEFVCDLAGSGKVRNSGLLDETKVAGILKFYDGDTSKKDELAWLISFIALLDIMKP